MIPWFGVYVRQTPLLVPKILHWFSCLINKEKGIAYGTKSWTVCSMPCPHELSGEGGHTQSLQVNAPNSAPVLWIWVTPISLFQFQLASELFFMELILIASLLLWSMKLCAWSSSLLVSLFSTLSLFSGRYLDWDLINAEREPSHSSGKRVSVSFW